MSRRKEAGVGKPFHRETLQVPQKGTDTLSPIRYVPVIDLVLPPTLPQVVGDNEEGYEEAVLLELPPLRDPYIAVSESNPLEECNEVIDAIMQNPFYVEALTYGEDPDKAKEQVTTGLKELYLHHPESFWHTLGVVQNASAIAEMVGLSPKKAALLRRAAFRHDEGKTSVPEYVLSMPKDKKFTPAEFTVLKDHAIQSYSIMVAQGDEDTANVAIGHHQMQGDRSYPANPPLDVTYEHYDLQVYLAIADVQDALGKKRSYKEAWPENKVREELMKVFGDRLLLLSSGENVEEAMIFRDSVIETAITGFHPVQAEPPLLERAWGAPEQIGF